MSDTFNGPLALARAMAGEKCSYRHWPPSSYLYHTEAGGFARRTSGGGVAILSQDIVGSIATDQDWWSVYTEPEIIKPRWVLSKAVSVDASKTDVYWATLSSPGRDDVFIPAHYLESEQA